MSKFKQLSAVQVRVYAYRDDWGYVVDFWRYRNPGIARNQGLTDFIDQGFGLVEPQPLTSSPA